MNTRGMIKFEHTMDKISTWT